MHSIFTNIKKLNKKKQQTGIHKWNCIHLVKYRLTKGIYIKLSQNVISNYYIVRKYNAKHTDLMDLRSNLEWS